MKKIIYIAAALFSFASCTGNVDPEDQGQDIPDEYVAPYTLSADRTEAEASGADYVTFSLKDKYGRDILLDRKALQSVHIVSEEGVRVPRLETRARFISNGTYSFVAKFRGEESNKVSIKAGNRGRYEKYHKNVAVYKATATWCPGCPAMTKALGNVNEDTKDHIVEMAWHSDDDFAIYLGDVNDCGKLVAAHLSGGSVVFPTLVYDLVEMYSTAEASSSGIETSIWNIRADYPATCGIKAEAKYNAADGKIRVEAELTSSTGGEYDFACAVLLNDQYVPSGTSSDGMYTHIVSAATPNYLMYSDSIRKVAKDASLPFEMNIDLGPGMNPDDLSIVVYAIVKEGRAARIDNIVEVELGKSVDYIYNE